MGLRDIDDGHCQEPQHRGEHPEIGVGFAIARECFITDGLAIDGEFAAQQMHQHAIKGFIQHLWSEELESTIAQQEKIIRSHNRD
ncbi:MAG: hypothetical protein JO249_12260 [Acidobacteria bacterium]|nr:hypothetical protein [Acidobacteriota bacterium]